MDEEEIEKAVIAYLKKKGFKQTEVAFQEEQQQTKSNNSSSNSASANSHTDPHIAKHILSFSESENEPAQYQEGYNKLRSWTYSSLDLYKHELLRVLYPVFIHCFMDLVSKGHIQEARAFFNSFREDHEMMHLRDLQKLEGVLSPSHLEEMEFAHSLRQSKVNIKICQVITSSLVIDMCLQGWSLHICKYYIFVYLGKTIQLCFPNLIILVWAFGILMLPWFKVAVSAIDLEDSATLRSWHHVVVLGGTN